MRRIALVLIAAITMISCNKVELTNGKKLCKTIKKELQGKWWDNDNSDDDWITYNSIYFDDGDYYEVTRDSNDVSKEITYTFNNKCQIEGTEVGSSTEFIMDIQTLSETELVIEMKVVGGLSMIHSYHLDEYNKPKP